MYIQNGIIYWPLSFQLPTRHTALHKHIGTRLSNVTLYYIIVIVVTSGGGSGGFYNIIIIIIIINSSSSWSDAVESPAYEPVQTSATMIYYNISVSKYEIDKMYA